MLKFIITMYMKALNKSKLKLLINTENNIADIFTKALCKEKFIKFRKLLNVK